MGQKKTFKILIILLVIMLTLLPVVTTFNSVLTALIDKIGLYKTLQYYLVPFESRLVIGVVRVFRIPAFLAPVGSTISFYLLKGKVYFPVQIQWNCLGWQSLLLLGISFAFGLDGDFSMFSKPSGVDKWLCIIYNFIVKSLCIKANLNLAPKAASLPLGAGSRSIAPEAASAFLTLPLGRLILISRASSTRRSSPRR